MKNKIGAILVVTVCAVAASAHAQTASLASSIKSLEARGYRVIDAETEGGIVDVDAVTVDNRRVELRLDAISGRILSEHPDN